MQVDTFTRTFGNMGFFQPPSMPFEDKPKLVTDEDLGAFREQEIASLRALKGLKELDLTACSKLTDSSLTEVGSYCHHKQTKQLPITKHKLKLVIMLRLCYTNTVESINNYPECIQLYQGQL